MKTKKRLMAVLALATICVGVFGLTACEEKHTHEWNEYISKQATCSEKGEVLYSCYCGENYTVELPIDSDKHNIVDEACVDCGKKFYGEELAYTLSDDSTYYIVKGIGKCTDKDIVIPDIYEGLPVTSIGDRAFRECTNLTSVTIPDSVTSIGDRAFSYCTSLTSVTIPDSVTSIGDWAFYNCRSLTSVTIPDSVTSIGYEAFYYCSSLTSVTIPDSVTSIGDCAFSRCTSLTSIEVDEKNANYSSLDGNLYNKAQTEFMRYAEGKTATSFTIPDSVTSIGDYAFSYCKSLTSVTIPDSVTSIGNKAFYDCSSLTSVVIPDGVTSIGDWVFSYCSSLTSMTIPDRVTSIGDRAFRECTNLTSVTIPGSVTSIGSEVFDSCTSLTSITFNGTIAQWKAIEKGSAWNSNVPATKVVCTDGRVSIYI